MSKVHTKRQIYLGGRDIPRGGNPGDVLTKDSGVDHHYSWQPGSGGVGEANTAANAGSGSSIFYQKVGVQLQFNGLKSENSLLTVVIDGVTHDVEFTVNEGLIDHDNLNNYMPDEHATPKNSIEVDTGQLQLVGDAASPGNSQLYGTNASGVKGWYAQPAGGGGSAGALTWMGF